MSDPELPAMTFKGSAKRSWYGYLVAASLVFLAIALVQSNYLTLPPVVSFGAFLGSVSLLFAAFMASVAAWQRVLRTAGCVVDFTTCLASVGLSTFGKYIPGKIWAVVGKAVYVENRTRHPLSQLAVTSLNEQFISVWVALSCGAVGLFLLDGGYLWGWLILALWVGLTAAIFSQPAHLIAERLIRSVFRKDIKISSLTIGSTLRVIPFFLLAWLLWAGGFYLLVASLTHRTMPWSVGLGFPLVTALGVMAFIAPGGVGVREGAIVGYLSLVNVPVGEATTIALASRLWFLIGEWFIFVTGWIADRSVARGKRPTRAVGSLG
ncbi:MAG: lysylphosphatidylglycerol synthase transmembrane domain-containing protein [Vicinamibacterales bacterium]